MKFMGKNTTAFMPFHDLPTVSLNMAVFSLLQSINDEEAILLSKKIENTLFASDGEVMEAKREN